MSQASELDWLLDDLVARVVYISKAVILSRDGLTIGASARLSKEDADHLSAAAAGFQSLARGVGRHFGGGPARQIIVEMLEKCNWNQTDAAERFHVPLSTLNQKIKRLNIDIKKKAKE